MRAQSRIFGITELLTISPTWLHAVASLIYIPSAALYDRISGISELARGTIIRDEYISTAGAFSSAGFPTLFWLTVNNFRSPRNA
jgi:hypothetical protein